MFKDFPRRAQQGLSSGEGGAFFFFYLELLLSICIFNKREAIEVVAGDRARCCSAADIYKTMPTSLQNRRLLAATVSMYTFIL